jgi:hypothetical protein
VPASSGGRRRGELRCWRPLGWVWLGIIRVGGGFGRACGRGASVPRVDALRFDGGVFFGGLLVLAVATDDSCV